LLVQTTALRIADALADAVGILGRPLNAEEMLDLARRQSGLSDFGDLSFVDPLHRFLRSCADEASLSLVGRMAARWDTTRFLTNLLRLRDAEHREPAILDQQLKRPIFITGLPRSGTTFLHRLLLQDPDNRAPRVWQTIYPYPAGGERDRRAARVARQLRAFERLAPEFRALHPLQAESPQECSEITAHVFRSLRFDTTYRIPSYRSWLDGAGHLPAYRFHKRFLQHLQHQHGAGQWVVKCPDHLFALDAIRAVYPDARLVFVHRDPVKVLLSVAKLTEVVRRPFTRRLDLREIGTQESARWLAGTQQMIAVGNDAGLAEAVHHVHYKDLVANPLGTIEALYRHFDLMLTPAATGAMGLYTRQRPNGGYGPRAYRFEDHGLDGCLEREKFRDYMVRFGIESEGDVDRHPGGPRASAPKPAGPMRPVTT
jgi:hypothetical protein